MAIAEGKLLAAGKQNSHCNILGINGGKGTALGMCVLPPILSHNLQIISVFIFFLPHIGWRAQETY